MIQSGDLISVDYMLSTSGCGIVVQTRKDDVDVVFSDLAGKYRVRRAEKIQLLNKFYTAL